MNRPADESTSVLEQFRQQWQDEVNSRSRRQPTKRSVPAPQPNAGSSEPRSRPERPINKPPTRHPLADVQHDEGQQETSSPSSDLIERIEGLRPKDVDEDDFSAAASVAEPKSALEHFEKAVEKESQGSLGDSLSHYRKAYRLDAKVDQKYKNKHFAHRWKSTTTTSAQADSSNTAGASEPSQPNLKDSSPTDQALPLSDLIASFADTEIQNAPPIIEGDRPPPCPIQRLPTEVLIELLTHIAARDPAIFARLALVSKRLAYHVFMENSIWKRVATGPEFGLASQQYDFATDVQGREAIFRRLDDETESDAEISATLPPVNSQLFPTTTDWRELFHVHPRIRFTGVYISTVNYTRSGGASATVGTWNSTVHIVTYYRYLRFFRDGTLISLLTTNDPMEVVHHLTRENMNSVRSGKDSGPVPLPAMTYGQSTNAPPPSAQNLMKHALRGRWRLCHPSLVEGSDPPQPGSEIGSNLAAPGDLHIETEGAGPRYMYTMHLGLKSGGRSKNATKNNKLVWKGFWSYNHLTNDWAEFHLKNDKAFHFSRVKSYGLGY